MNVPRPFLHSLRFQLPLSYAGIALVATLALGAVLLLTLRGYYQDQERAYLEENARALSPAVAEMVASGLSPADIEAQVKSLSFLTIARIQVLDAERNAIADSGIPDAFHITSLTGGGGPSQIFVAQMPATSMDVSGPASDVIIINSNGPVPDGTSIPFERPIERPINTYPPPVGMPEFTVQGSTVAGEVVAAGGGGGPGVVTFAIPGAWSLFGYTFSNADGEVSAQMQIERSKEHVLVALMDQARQPIGFLELSEGPAYGMEIVKSVARAWAIAGLLAVILAAGVGILVSRRMAAPVLALTAVTGRMADGDLSARATVTAPEELATLGQSFNEMAARVEDMISTLRNFVSDAAHELHTPLTALRTDLELAAETASPAPSSLEAGLITRALTQADRLKELVDNLLNLSRIEAREHLHAPLHLTALLREMAELYASRAEQAGLSFTLTGAEVEAEITGNEMQLRSAVGNLLENAIKFTPEGGHIGLTLEEDGEGWVIRVTDTGIGIPPEEIPHLFRRFHRARNVSDFPGNGLGLAIVKAIADAHGGRVGGENLYPGTRFSFWVPGEGNL